jgi:hypothetical protein
MFNIFKSRRGRMVQGTVGAQKPARSPRIAWTSDAADNAPSTTGYDPDDRRQHAALLEATYRHIHAIRDEAALVVFHACCACEVAILMRKHSQVDLFNLTFAKGEPSLSPTHPAMQVVELLELWVQDYFEQRSAAAADTGGQADDDAERRQAIDLSRMHAALMWKSYVFALGADPRRWQKDEVCALGILKILSAGDASRVIALLQGEGSAEVIRTNVRDDDWPPRAFINLYLRYGDLLADELSAIR